MLRKQFDDDLAKQQTQLLAKMAKGENVEKIKEQIFSLKKQKAFYTNQLKLKYKNKSIKQLWHFLTIKPWKMIRAMVN